MLMKLLIVLVMLVILGVLLSSLIFLVKDEGKTERTVKALTWRIILSICLFIFLFVAFYFHWIEPHGVS